MKIKDMCNARIHTAGGSLKILFIKMILDNYDLIILREFCKLKNNEETTTWRIMKKIYPKGKDRENTKIKLRIEKMAKYGLFSVDGNPKVYTLTNNCVNLNKIPKIEKCISVKIDGKWEIFEM